MIAGVFLQVLKVSLFTSILIVILLLLVPLLQKRYRVKWRYIVWLVIAIRLLIPTGISLPQAPVSIELPEQIGEAIYAPSVNAIKQAGVAVQAPTVSRRSQVSAWLEADSTAQDLSISEAEPESADIPVTSFTPIEIAAFIWLVGVIVYLLVQSCSYQIFLRRLKITEREYVPAFIKETVWRIGVDMGVCKLPEPIITNTVDAPVLIGVLRPRILMPHTQYGSEGLYFILSHELVHYRRRDMLYKLVLMMANALHWFNPMIYLLTIQAAKDIELACDDDVTRELDNDARARYGETILSALPRKRRLEPVFSTHFGSNKKNMKGRLRNLFDTTVKRHGTAALCVVAVCAIIATSFVTLGYAADSVSIKETTHSAVTIRPNEDINVISYPDGVPSPSSDKISLQVTQAGYKIMLSAEVKGESIRKIRLQSPDGKITRSYLINENGVQGGNVEYLTQSNALRLVSGLAETGTWTLYVDSPKPGEAVSISARLIDSNMFTFTTEELPEPSSEPVTKKASDKKDTAFPYDYYRSYDEAQSDIQSGYVFYMDKSFAVKAMPFVTGGSGSFMVHRGNTLNIDISMKNLINNAEENTEKYGLTLTSRIRFELISPSGETAYSFLRSGADLESEQAVADSVALTPGEWRYNIEFAYLTNGVDKSNLKITARYEKIYQEDIQWLLDHKLNRTAAETEADEAEPASVPSSSTNTEQKPLQNMTVRADAYDGTWAAASAIAGKTWQAQINDEMDWLYDTYGENKSGFVITEALSKSEASNVSRIKYLHDNSNVFRDMSKMSGGAYVVADGQFFTGSGFTLTTDMIHRTVVMADNGNDLYLDADYNLVKGKLAVWLIDPDGKIAYQGGLNSTYKGVRTFSGKEGLWSVVRVYQGDDNGLISGNIAITLRHDGMQQNLFEPAADGTNNAAVPSIENGQSYFRIVSNNGKNVANSGSFVAKTGQRLILTAESSIKGGTVDLFLFSPSGKEQRFIFDGSDKTATVELTAGTWAYNCTGFYESGSIAITGIY